MFRDVQVLWNVSIMRKAILHLKKTDSVLRGIIEHVGPYKMQFLEPTFATLARSIVFQQLSGKVARAIYGRLVEAMPDGIVTPDGVLKLRTPRMRGIGLSPQKMRYIR